MPGAFQQDKSDALLLKTYLCNVNDILDRLYDQCEPESSMTDQVVDQHVWNNTKLAAWSLVSSN